MFILLAIILTFIAISLKLSASGLELANKVAGRSATRNKAVGVARAGIATSISLMRVMAFVISRIRDLISFIGSLIVVLDVIILVVVVVSSSSYLILFSDTDEGGNLILNSVAQKMVYPSDGEVNTSNVGNKPEGLSVDSWNKADVIGKKIVAFSCDSVINPPNGKYLLYLQGDTSVGYADCSVFVCAVLEGVLNKTFSGIDAPNGYNFSINKKSDLRGYVTTYGMEDVVRGNPSAKIGTTSSSIDSALPGDVLLNDGHVGIYVGKNESGKHVMVHASTNTNPNCKGDINLADGQKLQVGFSTVWGTYDIIRPSKLLGH